MADTKDILIAFIGFGISFYGGAQKDLTIVVSGILIITFAIWQNLVQQEEEIKILKAQINTQNELKKIWDRLGKIENDNKQKR